MGGYIASDVDFDATGSEIEFSGFNAGIYGTYHYDGFFLDGLFKADFLDTAYSHTFPGESGGETDVISYGSVLDSGYCFELGMGFVEPMEDPILRQYRLG